MCFRIFCVSQATPGRLDSAIRADLAVTCGQTDVCSCFPVFVHALEFFTRDLLVNVSKQNISRSRYDGGERHYNGLLVLSVLVQIAAADGEIFAFRWRMPSDGWVVDSLCWCDVVVFQVWHGSHTL